MPSLFVYPIRGIFRKLQITTMSFKEKPECLVVSPGGCGTVSLINHLNKYVKSNIYFEKKYKFYALSHIYKPSAYLKKNKIKIILIRRSYKGIFSSLISRGYITHSLNFYGDCFPFFYINIFKNKKKIKKKFYSYLDFFYKNWMNYDKKRVLIINYKELYSNRKVRNKIKNFLNIHDNNFLKEFPKNERYHKKKKNMDLSTLLTKEIYKIKG